MLQKDHIVLKAAGLVKNLSGRPVLKGVDLELKARSVTAVLGPSGSGKTTLLRVIAGLENPDEGSVHLEGELVSGSGYTLPPEQRGLGLVFQNYALFPHMKVEENIAFGLKGRSSRKELVEQSLQAARLEGRGGAYPHELSGGEQQRVALARALVTSPSLVLMDEPFSSLDAALRRHIRDQALAQVRQSGAAVLIVTHDAEEALLIADQLVLMAEGRVLQTGTPEEVYLTPLSAEAARLTGAVNVWTGKVHEGWLATPFGPLRAPPSVQEREEATALVRPEGLSLHPYEKAHEVCAHVLRRRLRGALVEVELREEKTQTLWTAYTHIKHAPVEGEKVGVVIEEDLSSVVTSGDRAGRR